jgi:hypothetical protein
MFKVVNDNIRKLSRLERFDKVVSLFILFNLYARKRANRLFELIVRVEACNFGKILIILYILAEFEVQSRMLTLA